MGAPSPVLTDAVEIAISQKVYAETKKLMDAHARFNVGVVKAVTVAILRSHANGLRDSEQPIDPSPPAKWADFLDAVAAMVERVA